MQSVECITHLLQDVCGVTVVCRRQFVIVYQNFIYAIGNTININVEHLNGRAFQRDAFVI